jgi:hypothetical protein
MGQRNRSVTGRACCQTLIRSSGGSFEKRGNPVRVVDSSTVSRGWFEGESTAAGADASVDYKKSESALFL